MNTKELIKSEVQSSAWVRRVWVVPGEKPSVWHALIYRSTLQLHTACDLLFPLTGNLVKPGKDISLEQPFCLYCRRSLAVKVRLNTERNHHE